MISISTTKTRWRRVATFYGIALGWAVLVGAALYLVGQRSLGESTASWLIFVLALGYMPAPLVAALITEKLAGEGYLLRRIFTRQLGRQLLRTLVVVPLVTVALLASMLGLSWLLGNVVGISGAGRLLFSTEDLVANSLAEAGVSMDADAVAKLTASMPPLWGLLALTVVSAVLAGFTINGLAAFGEEYGWRGWLADELAPLGVVRANLLTGVMWGLWHAPLILLGYNYDTYRIPGVLAMIAWCTAGSFLLWRVRQATGSVLAAAIMHGAFNGMAGIFFVVLANSNRLLAAPMGAVGIAGVALVSAVTWLLARPARSIERPESALAVETPSPQN